jgi:Ca2+-binding RTX toxin-like protein
VTTTTSALDGLLAIRDDSPTARWNFGAAVGTKVSDPGGIGQAANLTYSFLTGAPPYIETTGFGAFSAAQRDATRSVLEMFEAISRISFSEIAGIGDITFGMDSQAGSDGRAFYPSYGYSFDQNNTILSVVTSDLGGDVWLNSNVDWQAEDFNLGEHGFGTLVHELGHALGLKHPFEGAFTLAEALNTHQSTVMAYAPHPQGLHRVVTDTGGGGYSINYYDISPETPMLLDVLALQYLYGANTDFRSGNDIYTFDVERPFLQTLWDAGGNDTLSIANFANDSIIDLRDGAYSSLRITLQDVPPGFTDPTFAAGKVYDGTDNLAIAFGAVIENAIGGAGDDLLQGNDAMNSLIGNGGSDTLMGGLGADTLQGGAGDDSLDGGEGIDVAVFSGLRAGYTLARGSTSITISGADGTDVLSGIERLRFDDGEMLLKAVDNDFDGDGMSDIAWRNSSSGDNLVWRSANNTTKVSVASRADQNFKIAAIADFDGDGKSDLFWRNTASGANEIWKTGNSATIQAVTTVSDMAWKLLGTGDFDGDGKADLFWRNASTGANLVWKSANNATQIAVTTVTDMAWSFQGTGDFDGDGKSDLLWRNTSTGDNLIWKSANNATKLVPTTVADQAWKIVGVGDFDGDGKSDILWRNASTGANTIWKAANSATVQATSPLDLAWTVMGTGDYGGDGKSDILWRNASTGANMVWSSGNSATVQPVTTVTDMAWRVVPAVEAATTVRRAAMDFDGDGKSDIVWRNTASGLDTIWKSGNSATTQTMTTVTDMAWKVAGIADFDADGRADILWRNTSTGANTIWKSANNATQQATTARADQNFKVLGTGDFDGDGKADILWRNLATGANEIWKSGNSATVQAMTTVTDMAWKVVGTGDFDADGKTDVLWRNTSTGANTIWKSANNATQQAVTARADQNFNVLGTADFDGDGKADILWRNLATGANEIWKSGNSATVQAVTPVTDMAWRIVGTGDFDGDGKSDILWRNASTGANTIWKSANNATQQATTAQPDQDWSIVDGLETGDLLFGGAGANTLLGTANNDTLFGAAGNDTLTGGLGNDTFRFNATNQGNDAITDFAPGTDKLLFVNTAFGNLAQGTLHAGNFVSSAAPAPTQAAPQFLYNSATGQLAFDADGTGGGVAVSIVVLVGTPALTASSILIGA